jgi:hypothetical protein
VFPHYIVAGAATVGLAARDSEILRRMLLPCTIYLALGGALLSSLLLSDAFGRGLGSVGSTLGCSERRFPNRFMVAATCSGWSLTPVAAAAPAPGDQR